MSLNILPGGKFTKVSPIFRTLKNREGKTVAAHSLRHRCILIEKWRYIENGLNLCMYALRIIDGEINQVCQSCSERQQRRIPSSLF